MAASASLWVVCVVVAAARGMVLVERAVAVVVVAGVVLVRDGLR